MADAVYTISVDSRGVVVGSRRAEDALKKLGVEAVRVDKGFEKVRKQSTGIQRSLARLGGAVAAAFSVQAITRFTSAAVEAALRMEALDQKLRVAAGSAAGAAREMEFVRGVVDELGLSLPEAAEGYAKFSVALKGTSLEGEQARKIFESISKASAVMRLSAEQTGGVFTALEQIVSKGTVSAEELRGQLGERLPGAFRFAAEAMGETTEALGDMLQKGELTAEDLLPKLARRLEEEFGSAALEAADSAQAAFNRFNTAMFDVRREIGKKLLPKFTELAGKITEFARSDDGERAIRELADAMSDAADAALQLFEAVTKLLSLGNGLADFFNSLQSGPDAERLRNTAEFIREISLGQSGLADKVDDYADSVERANEAAGRSAEIERIEAQIAALDDLALIQEKNANRAKGLAEETEKSGEALKGAADEAKKLNDELDRLGGSAAMVLEDLGIGSRELRELAEAEIVLRDALEKGQISLGDFGSGLQALREESRRVEADLNKVTIGIEKMKDALDRPVHTGVGGIADDVSELNKNARQASTRELPDLADSLSLVFDAAERVFDTIGEDERAKAARAILNVVNAVVTLQNALQKVAEIEAARQVAGGVQGAGDATQTASSAASASASLASFASYVNVAIAAFQAWVAVIEAFTTHAENPDAVFAFNPQTGLNAQLPGYAQEKFDNLSPETLEQVGAATEALGEFARGFTESLREIQGALGLFIPEDFGNFVVRVTESIEEGRDSIFRVTIDGITRSFESLAEATGHAVQEFLQRAIDAGAQVDEAVQQIINNEMVDPEQFQENLLRVQELVDQSNMALGGLSALEIEMRKLPASLQALRQELEQLGLSADQVERLVGGQLVASLQAWRQQITGVGLSVEEQRAQQRAQAELFNAERALRIADLEARRAELEAKLGLTRAEIELIRNGVQGYEKALRAKGEVYSAEIELLVKQIEAINKILEALANIPEINLGNLRLPGVPRISTPTPGPSPSDITDPAREAREEIDRLIRSLDDLAQETIRTIDELRGTVDGLKQLRDDLFIQTSTPSVGLAATRAQLIAARDAFRGGDLSAGADVQRLAQQYFNLFSSTFSPATAGFASRNRFLQDLLEETIGSGEAQIKTQEDLLGELNDRQADLLQELVRLGEINQEVVDEVRKRGQEETNATRAVEERTEAIEKKLGKLEKAINRFADIVAKKVA